MPYQEDWHIEMLSSVTCTQLSIEGIIIGVASTREAAVQE